MFFGQGDFVRYVGKDGAINVGPGGIRGIGPDTGSGAAFPFFGSASCVNAFTILSAASGNSVSIFLNKLSGAGGTSCSVRGQTNAVTRWILILGNTIAEAGANAGSNFSLDAKDDAGATIDSPIAIVRAAGGQITFSRPLNFAAYGGGSHDVSVGAADSGGAGFKLLRVPN